MITKFKIFEQTTPEEYKNNIDMKLALEPNNINKKNPELTKQSNLKITDIQGKIEYLNKQKALINQEIIKLQDAQRDLMPNNINDPQYQQKAKEFLDDQKQKMDIQKNKLALFDKEIKNLQDEIARNKNRYGV